MASLIISEVVLWQLFMATWLKIIQSREECLVFFTNKITYIFFVYFSSIFQENG